MLFFSRTKTIATLAVLALCFLLALPNALPASVRAMLPLFNGPVVLGLDLQGGSHVLLEVDQATLKDQYAKQLIGDIRQALRAQKIPYSGLGKSGDNVTVRITDPSRLDAAMSELRKLVQPIDTSLFGSGSSTKQYDIRQDGDQIIFSFTAAGLEYKIGRAIEQSLDIVGKRINAIGTTEPIIQRQGVDRILVQVPGLQDPSRLKDLLGQTAKLQFRLLCDSQPTSATERPPADCEAAAGPEAGRSRSLGADLEPRHRRRRGPERCPAGFRQPQQRADRQLPLQPEGALQFGKLTPRQCRQALRHRARQQGRLGAPDQRADPRRLRPDLRPLHYPGGQRPRHRPALRRLAGQAERGRGAARSDPSLDRIRSAPASSPRSSALIAVHASSCWLLRPVRRVRQYRAHRQPDA